VLGRLLGKAVYEGISLETRFAEFFLRKLVGLESFVQHLNSLDKELEKQLETLRKWDESISGKLEDVLCYNFTVSKLDGSEVELIEGGTNKNVTFENRFSYMYHLADYKLNREIKRQCNAFMQGFTEVVDIKILKLFNEYELSSLISGDEKCIDWKLKDLKT